MVAEYQNRSAANCTPAVASRATQWHGCSWQWSHRIQFCSSYKWNRAELSCDTIRCRRGRRCKQMTSFRQIEANQRNAAKSTGPSTEEGKRRSRQNAVRHGLCAETVVELVEDIDDYRGFEAAIIADYDARTAVERELVLRLASLLWRLRRATAIETDLLRIQAEILRERRQGRLPGSSANRASPILEVAPPDDAQEHENNNEPSRTDRFACYNAWRPTRPEVNLVRELTFCFQRTANLDDGVFERLGRYESAIARQVVRTLYLLRSVSAR
jgi:hypothetical protein